MPSLLAASRVDRIFISTTSVADNLGRSQGLPGDFLVLRKGGRHFRPSGIESVTKDFAPSFVLRPDGGASSGDRKTGCLKSHSPGKKVALGAIISRGSGVAVSA